MTYINKSLKIIFAGTPYFAANHLNKIISSHHNVIGILTQPDRPNFRGNIIKQSPVKKIAKRYNIPIFQPRSIKNPTDCTEILKIQADIMIVVAYGLILPQCLLNVFPMGCINVHASLLPHWRGAAPIQWAILKGEKKTGITIIQMEAKLDSGKILHQESCNILPNDTTTTLSEKLSHIGATAVLNLLVNLQNQNITPKKQNEKNATYAKKLSKSMGKINFFNSAKYIQCMIRAFNPWPGTYIQFENIKIKIHQAEILYLNSTCHIGQIIKIDKNGIQIQTTENILNIQKIQIPGCNIISIFQFINSKKQIFKLNQILK